MLRFIKLICIGLVYFFSSSLFCWAQVSPNIEWRTLKSGRFVIIHDAKQQELAKIYLKKFYQAEGFLKRYFDQFPDKLTIILNDRTDSTNGYATPMPYATIGIYPVLPNPGDSIGEFKDWGLELATHEYTHILSFEPKRGVFKFIHSALGSIATPNMLLPRWWLEGVAVEMETLVSEGKGGRLVSAYQDATLRALSHADLLAEFKMGDIAELSYPFWPYGSLPYLYGSLIWSDLRFDQPKEFVKNLHWLQAGRLPISLNQPLYDLTGQPFRKQLAKGISKIEQKIQKQKADLSVLPFTQMQSIGYDNIETFHPVISPDGLKMLFLAKGPASSRQLKLLMRPDLKSSFDPSHEVKVLEEKIFESSPSLGFPRHTESCQHEGSDGPPSGNINYYSWAPDSESFAYDLISESSDFEDRSQIWVFDLKKAKAEKLISDERAKNPSFSDGGQKLAYISMGPAKTSLKVFDLKTKKTLLVSESDYFVRYSYPVWISDKEVLVVERIEGLDQLRSFDIFTGKSQVLSSVFTDIRYLKKVKDQNFIIGSASVNGIPNMYQVSMNDPSSLKNPAALAHAWTGHFSADLDPSANRIYASVLTDGGYRIQSAQAAKISVSSLPKVKPILIDRYQNTQPEKLESNLPSYEFTEEEYSPWGYLRPYYWIPSISFGGSNQAGFSTGSQDPMAKHIWSLDLSYDFDLEESSHIAAYRNQVLKPALDFSSMQLRTYIVNTDTRYRLSDNRVSSTWQLPNWSTDLYVGLGFQSQQRSFLNLSRNSDGAFAEIKYGSLAKVGLQISPESGKLALLRYSDTNKRGIGFYEQYFSGFLPERHVLLTRFQAVYTGKSIDLSEFLPIYNSSASSVVQREVFLNRGYSNARFMMKTFGLANLEYRLPISYLYQGWDTNPIYFKRIHAAIVADAHQGRGLIYNSDEKSFMDTDQDKLYFSTGIELKADLTFFYQIPITTYVGVYQPGDSQVEESNQVVLGIQL